MYSRLRSISLVVLAILLIGAVTFSMRQVWRETGLRSLQAVNEPRVQLIASTVKAEISRQDHLPVVLSLDPDVTQALNSPADRTLIRKLNEKLKQISFEADTRALYVITPEGTVFAIDDYDLRDTQLGMNLKDRPYFRIAASTGKSTFLGVEPASDRVRYYVAHAIGNAPIKGVAVVRIEFDRIEADWQRAGEHVLVTDPRGTVFLSSDTSFKYQQLIAVNAREGERPGAVVGEYPESHGPPINLKIIEDRGDAKIVELDAEDGRHTFLYRAMPLPEYGWVIHRFSDLATIESDQRDGTIIGMAMSIIAISGLAFFRQRQQALIAARQSSARLSSEVAERTSELRQANQALIAEVEERRRTEVRLRDTQNTLIQAGKLAALGQMSAAIAHEINQPLAAIRTFVASTKIYLTRGNSKQVNGNLDLISGLAERMANITSHLKTFARKSDTGRAETVDVTRAIHGSMVLIESQIKLAGVALDMQIEPDTFVKGYAVQLEQILVNLLQNALQAVEGVKKPMIRIGVTATADTVCIKVIDNGSGISKEHLDKIFDPFFTTKPIGKGLGLGLSISYGIVRDFGGEIRAVNRDTGGIEMIVELPRYHPESAMSYV